MGFTESQVGRRGAGVDSSALSESHPIFTARQRWLYASNPRAWVKILVPAALGQALGVVETGCFEFVAWVLGGATALLQALAVVLLGAWSTRARRLETQRLFPELAGQLPPASDIVDPRALLRAGAGLGVLSVALSWSLELAGGRAGLGLGALACAAVLGAYVWTRSRLRGGSEVIEMVGLGIAIPWWQAYCQSGSLMPAGLVILPAFALLVLAQAMASGLPNETVDRWSGAKTFVTRFGTEAVCETIEGLFIAASLVWALLPLLSPGFAAPWVMSPAIVVLGFEYRELRAHAMSYDIDTYLGVTRYRHQVERAIVRTGLVLVASIGVSVLLASAAT